MLDAETVVPIVAIDPHYGPNRLPTIDVDNFEGAERAAQHLLSLGHRRIGFLGGRNELDSSHLREAGFRHAHAEAGIPVDPALIIETRYAPENAAQATRTLLGMAEPPTAIMGANDLTALAAIEVAHDLGLSVPGDLSVIGFDDIPEAGLASPALTTVRQPLQEMGAAAMRMLLDRIEGREHSSHVRLDTSLVLRETCAPPRP
ncbi:hypothetical protein GCM10025876_07600 [Demequina litorisediminis]|uniref:Transcriptional regulator LacI/GalR-like sensor domain-containing protein n=1 Tax=Demequina litorisediminis TaxID=1849022 RepID=A0ABQ6IA18_9MICO|nr:hypothetical protein GCM10025876_07600 [Demequina litorisediminis]